MREDKIFYVLNPDNNLANTQKKLEGELASLGGEGVVGEHPRWSHLLNISTVSKNCVGPKVSSLY